MTSFATATCNVSLTSTAFGSFPFCLCTSVFDIILRPWLAIVSILSSSPLATRTHRASHVAHRTSHIAHRTSNVAPLTAHSTSNTSYVVHPRSAGRTLTSHPAHTPPHLPPGINSHSFQYSTMLPTCPVSLEPIRPSSNNITDNTQKFDDVPRTMACGTSLSRIGALCS